MHGEGMSEGYEAEHAPALSSMSRFFFGRGVLVEDEEEEWD